MLRRARDSPRCRLSWLSSASPSCVIYTCRSFLLFFRLRKRALSRREFFRRIYLALAVCWLPNDACSIFIYYIERTFVTYVLAYSEIRILIHSHLILSLFLYASPRLSASFLHVVAPSLASHYRFVFLFFELLCVRVFDGYRNR